MILYDDSSSSSDEEEYFWEVFVESDSEESDKEQCEAFSGGAGIDLPSAATARMLYDLAGRCGLRYQVAHTSSSDAWQTQQRAKTDVCSIRLGSP